MSILELIEAEAQAVAGQADQAPKGTIHFPLGLIGFRTAKEYALICNPDESPFMRLQMLEGGKHSFLVVPTLPVLPEYLPDISDQDMKFLGLTQLADALVLAIVTFRAGEPIVSLKGPIVINPQLMRGKQIIPKNAGQFDAWSPLAGRLHR